MGHKHEIVGKYESKLKTVTLAAMIAVTTHSFNNFLGLCALTWASVVILGGYVQDLYERDFYVVALLLVLEAFRLAIATFFGNIVTRNLVHRSSNPITFRYDDSDRQKIITVARIAGQAGQVLLVSFTTILSLRHFGHSSSAENPGSFDGLRFSLRVFYSLVALHGIVSMIGAFHFTVIVPLCVTSYSLSRYYDEVVWRGMRQGLLEACNFDFLKFAFEVQTQEYRRNMRAPVVRALYKDLLEYLFWHNKGFAAAFIALDSSDTSEQEAAANIVGLWAELDTNPGRLRLQVRLLSKLADMVDNGEPGRAAVVSFDHLARIDPEGVLDVRSQSDNKGLIEILTKRIEEAVKACKYDKTLVYTKALIPLLKVKGAINPEEGKNSLVGNLRSVLEGDCLIRTKAIAWHIIRTLTNEAEPKEEDVMKMFSIEKHKSVRRSQYILEDEEEYLKELVGSNRSVLDEKLKVRKGFPAPPLSVVHTLTQVSTVLSCLAMTALAWFLNRGVEV